ncbi:MAG: lamin tail domain-containing protein, partial [Candidatus Peribacteraceae bacterium]|nr:lamin tail domain-containing protein [Candidatus Peribacteraceae bacterium]
ASGAVVGERKVSLNLEARSASGSLASATCNWDFGDGFTSDSCNPPSHAFEGAGVFMVQLRVDTLCGETVEQSLKVEVEEKKGQGEQSAGTGGGSGEVPESPSCVPLTFSGIRISEFLPNPYENEETGEWIELVNSSEQAADLCGWSVDDDASGSKPYVLDGESIQPHGFLLLPREQTKIALNNDGDHVRLFAPSASSDDGILVDDVPFERSTEGESLALRDDGHIVWTPYLTPGEPNRFRSAERRFATDTVVVAAALPNPAGKDGDGEWIEIANVSNQSFDLTGWLLDNKDGGSAPFPLDGIRLEPSAVRRLTMRETGIMLVNSSDVVRLLDPDRYVVSGFGWTEAVEERVYRQPVITTERASARIVNVVDGDTVDIVLINPDQLDRLPPSLKRRWLGLAATRGDPTIRVRMIGIDTPETVHPAVAVQRYGTEASDFTKALLQDQNVELEFDAETWDKYDRLLAYIYLVGGDMVQRQLLRHGLAYAYLRFPFLRADEFAALEEEARAARLGLWSDDEAAREITMITEEVEEEIVLEEEGLTLTVDPSSGRVASGTLVTFTPSVTADLYLSTNSGAFAAFSGTFIVTEDVSIAAFATRESSGSTLVTETVCVTYLLERASYDLEVTIDEVYPSPNSGEVEWIELSNLTPHDVQLGGWMLDDARGRGSRPWVIPGDIVVPASGSIILTEEQTGLAMNNDGDEVWLVSPDGLVGVMGEYGQVKKGRGVVFAPQTGNRELGVGIGNGKDTQPHVSERAADQWMATLLWG